MVYPNPAAAEVKVLNPGLKTEIIVIRDIMGKELLSARIDPQSSATLDISGLSRGIYLVEIARSGEYLKLVVR